MTFPNPLRFIAGFGIAAATTLGAARPWPPPLSQPGRP